MWGVNLFLQLMNKATYRRQSDYEFNLFSLSLIPFVCHMQIQSFLFPMANIIPFFPLVCFIQLQMPSIHFLINIM